MSSLRAFACVLLLLNVATCGQKGPLTLPEPDGSALISCGTAGFCSSQAAPAQPAL